MHGGTVPRLGKAAGLAPEEILPARWAVGCMEHLTFQGIQMSWGVQYNGGVMDVSACQSPTTWVKVQLTWFFCYLGMWMWIAKNKNPAVANNYPLDVSCSIWTHLVCLWCFYFLMQLSISVYLSLWASTAVFVANSQRFNDFWQAASGWTGDLLRWPDWDPAVNPGYGGWGLLASLCLSLRKVAMFIVPVMLSLFVIVCCLLLLLLRWFLCDHVGIVVSCCSYCCSFCWRWCCFRRHHCSCWCCLIIHIMLYFAMLLFGFMLVVVVVFVAGCCWFLLLFVAAVVAVVGVFVVKSYWQC